MKSKRLASGDFLWLALVLLVALGIAFLLPVTPQDYWWYLRIGRETLASGGVPRVDTLTYTQAGQAVDYQAWGAAVLFWLLYRAGGLTLTVLLRGVLIALAYGLVWAAARRAGAARLGTGLVLLAAVLTSSNNWSVRPQLFAYPLFALAIWILYAWQQGQKRLLAWLPLISLVWVNLHGSYVMLILLVGAALVFGKGERRSLGLAFAGVVLATLANPRLFGGWTYVFNSLTASSSQQFSAEWQPPVNTGWQMNIFFLWLIAFPLLVVLSPRRLSRLEWTWFLGFGILALLGERYVIWFVLILVVLTSLLLADWERKWVGEMEPGLPALSWVLAAIFLLLPLAFLPGFRQAWWRQAPPTMEDTPVKATAWLAAHPDLPGPLWSEIGFASYLEFALPSRPVWIDTRFEVFPVTQWQDYRDLTDATWDWEALLDGTGARILMVSVQYQPQLLDALRHANTWCEQYQDDVAVIFLRAPCGISANIIH
ncbi:MAG: hypothetical protein ABSB41_16570 [Anaerolineales bacterium]|jgi:hypothetical protein